MKMKLLNSGSALGMLLCLIFVILLTASCENDLYDEGIKDSHRKEDIQIKNHSWEELSKDFEFMNAYGRAKNSLALKNAQGRAMYGQEVDTTLVKEVLKEGYKSYSIRILNPEESERYYQNLLIELDSLDRLAVAVLSYYTKPTKEIDSIKVDYIIPKEFMQANETGRCNWIEVVSETSCYGSDSTGNHFPGDGCNCDGSNPDCHPPTSSTAMYVICTPPQSIGVSFNITLGNMSQTTGGSHGGSFAPNQGLSPDRVRLKNLMMHQLDPAVSQWLNQHEAIQASIWSFLENVPLNDTSVGWANTVLAYPQDLVEYVDSLVNQMIVSDMVLDPVASYKSPANIDLTALKPNPDNPSQEQEHAKAKFLCVFNKLMKSPKFKELFIDVFGNDLRPNIKFQVDQLSGNQNGGLVGQTISNEGNYFCNLIKVDDELLLSGNTVYIAQTIIHELIHAMLNVIMADSNFAQAGQCNEWVFPAAINQYFTIPGNQHQFMFNNVTNSMVAIFQEIQQYLFTPQQITNINEQISIHLTDNQGNTSTENFSWPDFYQQMAINGLQNATSFQSEIATVDPNNANIAATIVDHVKWSKFQQYKLNTFSMLPHQCN